MPEQRVEDAQVVVQGQPSLSLGITCYYYFTRVRKNSLCYITIIVSRRRRVLYAYEYAPATCRVDAASLRAAFCDFIRCVRVLLKGVKCESMAERSFHIVFSICVVPGGEWLAETKRNETKHYYASLRAE